MKKARLKVVGLKLPSIISFDSVLCQVTASAIRCSRGARLFLSRAAIGGRQRRALVGEHGRRRSSRP